MEPWTFSVDLRDCIGEYYENHPELGVKVLRLEGNENESDSDPDEDDDDNLDSKKNEKDETKYH